VREMESGVWGAGSGGGVEGGGDAERSTGRLV